MKLPAAGPHGGDVVSVARALGVDPASILDLSASLNPEAPDVGELIAKHLDALNRYPEPSEAREAMAEALEVAPERVLLTNGGSEAIALVCSMLGRAEVARPEFSLYERHLAEVVSPDDVGPGSATSGAGPRDTAPRIASNPNNPTGLLAAADERAAVWDEAFYPLATGRWTRGDIDTLVVGSLTKVFACPGLRIGYIIGEAEVIERLERRQPRWSVNGLACATLPDLLARADLPAWQQSCAIRRAALTAAIPGVLPSDAPYALIEAPIGAATTRAGLASRGVLVRDTTNFGLPNHIRVAVPDEAGLRRLVEAWNT